MSTLLKYGLYFFAIITFFKCSRGYVVKLDFLYSNIEILDPNKYDDVLDNNKPKDAFSPVEEWALLKLLRRSKLENMMENFNPLDNSDDSSISDSEENQMMTEKKMPVKRVVCIRHGCRLFRGKR